MKQTSTRIGLWFVRRNPRLAAKLGWTVVKHPRRTAMVLAAARHAPMVARRTRVAAKDPEVQAQFRVGRDALGKAARRLRDKDTREAVADLGELCDDGNLRGRDGCSLCAPESAVVVKPGGTPTPKLIERNLVEVTFRAAPGAARKVLNEITDSTGQFFIIRTLYVHNEKDKGPPRERAGAPVPAPNPQASPGQSPAGALNFIVGNEHVEVSATVEMLRFTF